jgi:1-acyl-sn-glycerol-3-phosphate acyltransferase
VASLKERLFGVITYAEFAASAVAFVPVLGAINLAHRGDATPRVTGRWLRRFGKATAQMSPLWSFSTEGAPPADITSRPYVVVANHASMADPFLLCWLPWDMQWVAKEELFRPPVVGWLMKMSGDIALRRGSGDSVRAMIEECRKSLRGGLSVMIFPEGTRTRDGNVQPFKDGAFQLALEEQVPILPVAIAGTRNCTPKGSKWLGEATAISRVLIPIETAGKTVADLAEVRDAAREQIATAVTELDAKLARAASA